MHSNFSLDIRFAPAECTKIRQLFDAGIEAGAVVHGREAGRQPPLPWHSLAGLPGALGRGYFRRSERRRLNRAVAEFCERVEQISGETLMFEDRGPLIRWTHGADTWTYPASREKMFFFGFLTAVGPRRWLANKYTLPGFVELEANDVVVDCGAFVGGFARAAVDTGATVIAVEPSRTNQACLRLNVDNHDVLLKTVGLGRAVAQKVPFHESSTGLDSSFGDIDEGGVTETYAVDILTVDELCARSRIRPTFLKVEAEGMEQQILVGMSQRRPAKLAVDGSPEGGSDDRDAIVRHLQSLGYNVRTDINMIYARLEQ